MTASSKWAMLARSAGRSLARSEAYMDDYRMWNATAVRYGFSDAVGGPLALDLRARWWAKWLWFLT